MSRVAKRYAKALFELATENGLEQVALDMRTIQDVFSAHPELGKVMSNPLYSSVQKERILFDLFEHRVCNLVLRFISLVAQKRRLAEMSRILLAFNTFLMKHQNQVSGELVSVVPFTDAQIGQLKASVEKLTGKNLILNQVVNPSIIGGFIIRIDDLVVDSSIRTQLEKIRHRMAIG